MANAEHVAILKQGVNVWNMWRLANQEILHPDLREADLCGVDLRWVDLIMAHLRWANLTNADLRNADLTGANLIEAKLDGARLGRADLRGAKLDGAHLSRADFSEATLTEAHLDGAHISDAHLNEVRLDGAHLQWTNLTNADLTRTNLTGANLTNADLTRTNLTGANLTNADLTGTHFNGANLEGADLSLAHARRTQFDNINLSSVRELEAVRHDGPSTIGVDTLYKSGGNIPESFLRGCGVPQIFIENRRYVLQMKAFDFYSTFISYSSKDRVFSERLHTDLQAKGIRVWFAPDDLKIGDPLHETIDQAIIIYDKLLLVLSENSINSAWVHREVENGLQKEEREKRLVLFPVRLDNSVFDSTEQWAYDIRKRHIGDFTRWKNHDDYQKVFDRLLRDLQAEPK